MVAKPLRLLLVEDSADDEFLLIEELKAAGFTVEWVRVQTEAEMRAALERQDWDLVVSDHRMPCFSSREALSVLQQLGLDLPFIIVSGSIGEELAVQALKAGAHDFIDKRNLSRLGPVVQRELQDALARREQRRVEQALKQKQEELVAMGQQLWQAARLATMGELAAGVAHELNNPLATVSLRLELLLAQTPPEDPRRRPLEVIEGEVERMSNLVTNLLQFARRQGTHPSTADIRAEVDRAFELVQGHLRSHRVEVAREYAPELPLVLVDTQQLRQLLLNLIVNAVDAMPEGGKLTACVHPCVLEDDAAVCVELSDTGVGIPPELLPKVMEPFFTTKPEGKGTGLGLAICRRIVQKHGGELVLESTPGQGTTARLVLPLDGPRPTRAGEDSADRAWVRPPECR